MIDSNLLTQSISEILIEDDSELLEAPYEQMCKCRFDNGKYVYVRLGEGFNSLEFMGSAYLWEELNISTVIHDTIMGVIAHNGN